MTLKGLFNIFHDPRPLIGQDPHVSIINGEFILCESQDEERIVLSSLSSLQSPRRLETRGVWENPSEKQLWAPELHKINGMWYIYYASSDGENRNHRTYVLRAENPFGPYESLGRVGVDVWAIDMTTFAWDSLRYAVWSGWENNGDEFPQNLYIARMYQPHEIGDRVLLAKPELEWEKSVAPILEGPQACLRGDQLSLLYAANASWKQEYSTGILTLVGRDPMNPRDWEKRPSPVLSNAGHGMLVGEFLVYARKMSSFPGWSDREIKTIKVR